MQSNLMRVRGCHSILQGHENHVLVMLQVIVLGV